MGGDDLQGTFSIGRGKGIIAAGRERGFEKGTDSRIVLDDQDFISKCSGQIHSPLRTDWLLLADIV